MGRLCTDGEIAARQSRTINPILKRALQFHQFRTLMNGDPLPTLTSNQSALEHRRNPRRGANPTDLSRPLSASSCTCKIVNQTTQIEVLPFAYFRKVMRQNHYGGCPMSSTSDITLELLISVILPLWLLRYTINLSMVLRRSNSNRAWKISPIVLGASRIVDPAISPAFQAIRNAQRSIIQDTRTEAIVIESLEDTIRHLIRDGKASVLDEDGYGITLLYVS